MGRYAIIGANEEKIIRGKRERESSVSRPVVTLSLNGAKGAIHLPAIETVFLDTAVDLGGFDAVIFTSKQAVKALDRRASDWKRLKLFSIGAATSETIASFGGEVCFESPSQNANQFAAAIASLYGDLAFFYPRARVVFGDLEGELKRRGVACRSEILYETAPKPIDAKSIPPNAAIVFSAPSVVKSFFSQIKWQSGWRAIALGESAAKALESYAPCLISPQADIEAAVAFAALAP